MVARTWKFRIATIVMAMGVTTLALALVARAGVDNTHAKTPTVSIKGLKFVPSNLKIRAGQTVLWINQDDNDHTVISDDPRDKSFRSDNLGNGDTFHYTFNKPGKFPYHCKYHPRMKGMVVVSQ